MLTDAKYYIIKSSNQENIDLSRKYSEWATTKSNEIKLNDAFRNSKNVFLIFSVNKSAQYQGFARMCSEITNKFGHYWKNTGRDFLSNLETIKLGGCFKIEWITYANLNFNRLSAFTNPLNNNEPIKKSRDTQELPAKQGKEISRLFEIPMKEIKEEVPVVVEQKYEESSSDDIFGEAEIKRKDNTEGDRVDRKRRDKERDKDRGREKDKKEEKATSSGLSLQNFGAITDVKLV